MKLNPAYAAANKGQFSANSLDAPAELLVEVHGFREGTNKSNNTAYISQEVKILDVISNPTETNVNAVGKEFDILTNFGEKSSITISTLVKAFKAYGFDTSKWNDDTESLTQFAIMVPASLKYLAVHKVKAVVKLVTSKQEGKDAVNFPNFVKFVRHDVDGIEFPNNPPEKITYEDLEAADGVVLEKDKANAAKGF